MTRPLLTSEDARKLAAALSPHYPGGIPEPIFSMACDWLAEIRIAGAMADVVLDGEATLWWEADDWHLEAVAS